MTPKTRNVALRVMKHSAAGLDRIRPPHPGLVVLIYHRVGGKSRSQIDLPTSLFEHQMAVISSERRVLSLDAALAELALPNPPAGPTPVVVTFDDGTADFADAALPILEKYRVPATLYVATAFIEESRPFPGARRPLSWAALADAVSTGIVTVGSHTHTHALLDRIGEPAVEDELDRSIGLLRDRLGVPAEHFAYPKALAGRAAGAAVARRFRSAAVAGTRPNRYGYTHPYALNRSPIQVADEMRWFHCKVAGGMALEDHIRDLVNRVRYAQHTA